MRTVYCGIQYCLQGVSETKDYFDTTLHVLFRVADIHHTQVFCLVCSPDDEHNDARNMLS